MWGLPMFDLHDAAGVLMELNECRKLYGDRYIRMSAFDPSHGWESLRLSFIVNRPKDEPGFRLERQEVDGRKVRYTTKSYAVDRPEGRRYGGSTIRPPRTMTSWSFRGALDALLRRCAMRRRSSFFRETCARHSGFLRQMPLDDDR
jgi:hypothetical protein